MISLTEGSRSKTMAHAGSRERCLDLTAKERPPVPSDLAAPPKKQGCAIVRSGGAPLDARGQRVSKSQPVTMMANLEEMSRVLHSHDWARVQDWVTALDQLATLTDDEIAALVQAARPPASSVRRR